MKHLQTNQDFRFNEILFEGRNKQYGAYVLRNESDRILTKALFIGVSLLAAISLTPMLISAFKTTDGIIENPPPFILKDIVEVELPPVKVQPVKPVVQPERVKQYDATVVTPTRNADESKIVKDIPKDAVAGFKNDFEAKPATPDVYIPISADSGPGKFTAPKIIPSSPVEDPLKIETELSVSANFESGIESFRNKVMNKFDGSGFSSDDVMKTTVTFIVEKDGTISGIKADGRDSDFNAEALRTIKAVKGKWIPGKNKKGEPVRSYFKFPISMKFDN